METISYGEVPPGTAEVPAQDAGHLLGGTYLLEREIGRGGMGEVYLATHARLPGRYAVKLLLPELAENREAFTRFCREAEIMSELRHPNIVQIFDFNIAPDERPYFVMEYLEGRDLEARLASGPLPLAAVVRIVNAVASALAVAHAHGVVHRDLKPSNIFLATINGQTDELVKVLDFGISKIRSAPQQLVSSTNMMGTPPYMAPEQVRGHVDAIDGRTDQFALGVIAYRMLTGQEAFRGDDVGVAAVPGRAREPAADLAVRPADVGSGAAAGRARSRAGEGARAALGRDDGAGARLRGRRRADDVCAAPAAAGGGTCWRAGGRRRRGRAGRAPAGASPPAAAPGDAAVIERAVVAAAPARAAAGDGAATVDARHARASFGDAVVGVGPAARRRQAARDAASRRGDGRVRAGARRDADRDRLVPRAAGVAGVRTRQLVGAVTPTAPAAPAARRAGPTAGTGGGSGRRHATRADQGGPAAAAGRSARASGRTGRGREGARAVQGAAQVRAQVQPSIGRER